MEIKSTYTVDDRTFETEQEAIDYVHFVDRKHDVEELIKPIFKNRIDGFVTDYNANGIANQIVKHPEIFRKALDIVDGK